MTKINDNREKIFWDYKVLDKIKEDWFFQISSTDINKYKEARLMTKFDSIATLPAVFLRNNLTILPDKRWTYIIWKFNTYFTLEKTDNSPEEIDFPDNVQTINPGDLYSENSALLCAFNSWMISDLLDLDESEVLFTVSGRMSTKIFDFYIQESLNNKTHKINVSNAQCEIDAWFESNDKFIIVEAKKFEPDDFNVRQLYFPYRLWEGKINKEVIPVFMYHSNDIFHFYVFKFNEKQKYNSIELVKHKKYIIKEDSTIEMDDILHRYAQTKILEESTQIPFPQANSFSRVVDVLTLLYSWLENINKKYIADFNNFVGRQADYYINALRYLWLAKIVWSGKEQYIEISSLGTELMRKSRKEKYLWLTGLILEHRVFNEAFELAQKKWNLPSIESVVSILKDSARTEKINLTTMRRRASTIIQWLKWILNLSNNY